VVNAKKAGDRSLPASGGTEDRGQKTRDRIGKSGNQDNRVQVIRITGNQDAGNQQTRESGTISLITRYSDNHCLVTRYADAQCNYAKQSQQPALGRKS